MEPLPHRMELQSLLMEPKNQPMEHHRHRMEPQSPHTEHQSLLMEPQSLHITAQQQCQRQCMLPHLPSTRAHPTEPPQPQWCNLPMSGIRERQTSRPPLTSTLEWMFLAQQGKEDSMNAIACLLHSVLLTTLWAVSSRTTLHLSIQG